MKTFVQKTALFFGLLFLFVYVLTNIPAFDDAQGRNFGLFVIDPIDDIVHLLTAIVGIVVAFKSIRYSIWFLIIAGIFYELDAIVGLVFSRGLLDLSLFTLGAGVADFTKRNIYLNLPHIIISTTMIGIGIKNRRVLHK